MWHVLLTAPLHQGVKRICAGDHAPPGGEACELYPQRKGVECRVNWMEQGKTFPGKSPLPHFEPCFQVITKGQSMGLTYGEGEGFVSLRLEGEYKTGGGVNSGTSVLVPARKPILHLPRVDG